MLVFTIQQSLIHLIDHIDEQSCTEFNPLLFGHESSDSCDEGSDSYNRCLHESIPYSRSSKVG